MDSLGKDVLLMFDIYRYFIDIGIFVISGLLIIYSITFLIVSIQNYVDVSDRKHKGIVLMVKMYLSAISIAVFILLFSYYAMNYSIIFS